MTNGLKHFLPVALLAFCVFSSCDKIHEFPEPGSEIDPTEINTHIKIKCKVLLDGMDAMTKSGDPIDPAEDLPDKYDRRFIVEFRAKEDAGAAIKSLVFTRELTDTSDLVIDTKLHALKYGMAVWMDYVRKGSSGDLYYLTSDGTALDAVHQQPKEIYVAGSDFKDAQTFTTEMDLTPYAGQWFADFSVSASLFRPVAKITVLASDLADYAASIGFKGPLSEISSLLAFEFSYDGYFTTGYNAFTGRMNDSETGYGFKSRLTHPYPFEDREYSRIGSDFVFVNDQSSSVTLSIRIKTKDGKLVNEVNNLVVPVNRGRETVLIREFFTKKYDPGIGVDPGFDGEYDIIL